MEIQNNSRKGAVLGVLTESDVFLTTHTAIFNNKRIEICVGNATAHSVNALRSFPAVVLVANLYQTTE